ncbi:isthmin-1 isoform X1 [Nematostella vectensis]|uniref:isthmin-1 isoform X1 n=1 Tax=Nematostella vectensis TaxID=45351 RepID=UPI00139050E7|nr:isthmin-1 isoform X1 [Nematostella vectensis]
MDSSVKGLSFLLVFYTGIVTATKSVGPSQTTGWSNWSNCSVPCGTGVQTRNRSCEGCIETRTCSKAPCLHDASMMIGVIFGVSAVLIVVLFFVLVCTFFIKEKSERKVARKSSTEWSTPGTSRRTLESNVDFKLSVLRKDQRHEPLRNPPEIL